MGKLQNIIIILIVAVIIVGGIFWYLSKRSEEKPGTVPEQGLSLNIPKIMNLESPVFSNNGNIPSKYSCRGENINPPLKISGVPQKAKSLVLIVDDPDAPRGTWVHWTVWNISPKTIEIQEDSVPEGAVEGMTDFGKPGYGGPCPPSGTHHYFFKLFALNTTLDISSSSRIQDLEKAMAGHILDKAQLIGLYSR